MVQADGRPIPAELAVLQAVSGPGESGAWLNSRGTKSGVVDLVRSSDGRLKTRRRELPAFVSKLLESLYDSANLNKGASDLVVWNSETRSVRFVEVKCPHWDSLSPEQRKFLAAARDAGMETSIAEWEFAE